MAWNRQQLKDDLLVQLGSEQVPVELGNRALEISVNNTIEVFEQYKPLIRIEPFKTPGSGMFNIPLPADVTGVRSVELIAGIDQTLIAGGAIESQMLSGYPVFLGVGDTSWDVQYLDIRRRWIKTVAREMNSEPDYEVVQDPATQLFTIYTYSTGMIYGKAYVAIHHKEDLTSIPNYWHKWFRDYALSEAKLILAGVRGKFVDIPVAGTKMRMNAETLIAQAEKKQVDLIDIMERSRSDLFPQWA